jgi:hypothetical protein
LDSKLRQDMAVFRLESFPKKKLPKTYTGDPCLMVKRSPPWMMHQRLDRYDIGARAENVFKKIKVVNVHDMLNFELSDLMKMKGFSWTTASKIFDVLQEILNSGPSDTEVEDKIQFTCFADAITALMSSSTPRARDILSSRMGWEKEPQTLQEIGNTFNLTRERVRQIEKVTAHRFDKRYSLTAIVLSKLNKIIEKRGEPLRLDDLGQADPWFSVDSPLYESKSWTESFIYTIERFTSGEYHSLRINGVTYIGRLTQEDWNQCVVKARHWLLENSGHDISKSSCKQNIAAILPDKAFEFGVLLWNIVSPVCNFKEDQAGDGVLLSYGYSAESLVKAVLDTSPVILHFNEVAEKVYALHDTKIEISSIRNAAAIVGILLDYGKYGSERHLVSPPESRKKIAKAAESIMLKGDVNKQWHVSEILDLLHQDAKIPADINKYELDYLMHEAKHIQWLGRQVWVVKQEGSTRSKRVFVSDSVVNLLQSAGRPLSLREITESLAESRSAVSYANAYQNKKVLRVTRGVFGLNDRDVSIKKPDQKAFADQVVSKINDLQRGLHLNEIKEVLSLEVADAPEALFSIACLDDRIKASSAGILYLKEFEAGDKPNVNDIIIDALKAMKDKPIIKARDILEVVEDKIGSKLKMPYFSQRLQMVPGIEFKSGSWTLKDSSSD